MSKNAREFSECVRHVARSMLSESESISTGTADAIIGAMGELRERGAAALVGDMCRANTGALLYALANGVSPDEMFPTADVLQMTRAVVQRGMSHDSLLRGYRVGIGYQSQRWTDSVGRYCDNPALALKVAGFGTSFLLRWLDIISDQLTVEFRDEAERIAREGTFAWADFARRLLANDNIDLREAGIRLGYDLGATHVGVVLSHYRAEDDFPLEATARTLARSMTKARPLIVRVDINTTWCWMPLTSPANLAPVQEPVIGGIGTPAKGIAGFRRSHREAQDALRVVRETQRPSGTIARFDAIELEALCGVDPDRCRAFVAEKLGGLLGEAPEQVRLRETLAAYFLANCNFRAAAASLGIHHNTVRYRIEQIENILGRPLSQQRLALELALHLAEAYGR